VHASSPPEFAAGSASRRWGDPGRWFTEGLALRHAARRSARCAECGRALRNHRTPYCSQTCQWKFCGRYFWDSARHYVLRRDRYTCQHCHGRMRVRQLEVDHVLELARGGAEFDPENLQTLCRPCHRLKTAAFLRRWNAARSAAARATSAAAARSASTDVEWFPA
jgi:5-methylcytosine-specific restriction endonuclease McrA